MQSRAGLNNGYIPISVFLTFKRVQALNADEEKIKEALKDSKVVEIKDDCLKKIETKEYSEYLNLKDLSERIIYMKGFDTTMNLDDIQNIIRKYFTPQKITLRRGKDKQFKGSCFVECSSVEDAKEALELKIPVEHSQKDEVKRVKTEESFIEIMTKDDFVANHRKEEVKKEDNFAEKVKANFIPRLFKYECDTSLTIEDVKKHVKDCAFADVLRKVIRLKYIDERDTFDIEVEKDGKEHKLTLVKFSEDEAKEYVKNLTIKKKGGKGKN
jgi:lupus La protein